MRSVYNVTACMWCPVHRLSSPRLPLSLLRSLALGRRRHGHLGRYRQHPLGCTHTPPHLLQLKHYILITAQNTAFQKPTRGSGSELPGVGTIPLRKVTKALASVTCRCKFPLFMQLRSVHLPSSKMAREGLGGGRRWRRRTSESTGVIARQGCCYRVLQRRRGLPRRSPADAHPYAPLTSHCSNSADGDEPLVALHLGPGRFEAVSWGDVTAGLQMSTHRRAQRRRHLRRRPTAALSRHGLCPPEAARWMQVLQAPQRRAPRCPQKQREGPWAPR